MPPLLNQDNILMRLVKDVNDIRANLRRTVANLPLYDISNENTPAIITVNQNNYVPGNYDVLMLSSDAPGRTITGFTGGVKGRFLRLINNGSFEIIVSHESASSALGNRVHSPTNFDMIVNSGGELLLYYDFSNSKWIASWASNSDRIACRLNLSASLSIPNISYTPIAWSTVVSDTGGFFDLANPTIITIPETGWYDFRVQIVWDVNATGLRELFMTDEVEYNPAADSRVPVTAAKTIISISCKLYRSKGSTMLARVWQNSGAALNILVNKNNILGANWTYTEFNISKS